MHKTLLLLYNFYANIPQNLGTVISGKDNIYGIIHDDTGTTFELLSCFDAPKGVPISCATFSFLAR